MTQHESDRADKISHLKRLGVEYEGQTVARVQQWADELEYATPDQVARAVQKLLDDPERKFLPKIGEIKALIPRTAKSSPVLIWDVNGNCQGDITRIPENKRREMAAYILRCWHPKSRESAWFMQKVRPFVLNLDPKAFDREAERSQARLPIPAEVTA